MTIEELIQICRDRNEIEFLFEITKEIAEADSIGEGYGYCHEYTKEMFNNAERVVIDKYGLEVNAYCDYLIQGGLPVYELYLKHMKVI